MHLVAKLQQNGDCGVTGHLSKFIGEGIPFQASTTGERSGSVVELKRETTGLGGKESEGFRADSTIARSTFMGRKMAA